MNASDTARRGIAVESLQRRARLFTLALWGKTFDLRIDEDAEASHPYVQHGIIHLPIPAGWRSNDTDHYRAAAAHAAAHQLYGTKPLNGSSYKARQRLLIELIEDIRIEQLACLEFPGLRRLWLSQHLPPAAQERNFPQLVRNLSHCLLEHDTTSDNLWIHKGVRLFHSARDRWTDSGLAVEVGLQLANDLGQMRVSMNEGDDFSTAPYRDDNRHLWRQEQDISTVPSNTSTAPESRPSPFLIETGEGRDLALADSSGPAPRTDAAHLQDIPDQAVLEYRRGATRQSESAFTYPEWDYRLGWDREAWCNLVEHRPAGFDGAAVEVLLRRHHNTLARMKRLSRSLRLERRQRIRRQYQGDEIDLDAALQARADLNRGREPDLRVYERSRPLHDGGLASLLLLDLSESTNDRVDTTGQTLIELTRETALLMGEVLNELGEAFAIAGFHSRGRHEVDYYTYKDFNAAYAEPIRAAIAAATGQFSTRMGTALRHAAGQLCRQPQQRRLLLIVTDGAPADIDCYDNRYLVEDARRAVQSAQAAGLLVFAVSLDPQADHYLRRIFSPYHYLVLERAEQLPQRLPQMFMTLIRHY